jgi:hypothetical protein
LNFSINIDGVFKFIFIYTLINYIYNMSKFSFYLEVYSGCLYADYNMIGKYIITNKENGSARQEECKEKSEFRFQKEK